MTQAVFLFTYLTNFVSSTWFPLSIYLLTPSYHPGGDQSLRHFFITERMSFSEEVLSFRFESHSYGAAYTPYLNLLHVDKVGGMSR